MEFIDKDLAAYAEDCTQPQSALLEKIDRETHLEVLIPRMLSGHLQGRLLSMISHMIRPSCILEIGTYTGYSALCLAEGLHPAGKLITIDKNEELEDRVRGYFEESDYTEQIDFRIGNALDILKELSSEGLQADLVFIDADKVNYLNYYKAVVDAVPSGGFLLADNTLWSGKVLAKNRKKLDDSTQAILDYNAFVKEDERVETVLLPIRDGLNLSRKK